MTSTRPDGERSRSVSFGRWLFRWRGLTPVPVIAAVAFLALRTLRASPPRGAHLAALAGLGACLLGQALRAWVRGVVTTDSSNQGRSLSAGTLNIAGAYRFTRNPLYLGNLLLVAGLLVQVPDPLAWLLGLGFFFGQYYFIIRAEEDYLLSRFGDPYRRLLAEVPRFFPRFTPAPAGPAGAFDGKRALFTEHNTAAAWLSGLFFLSLLRAEAQRPAPSLATALPALAGFAAVGATWLAIKGAKRGW